MELSDYRAHIDRIDAELLRLFAKRMQTAAGIASYKKAHGLPVLDAGREREKLAQIVKAAPEELQEEAVSLYRLLFSLSRSYQRDLLDEKTALPALLKAALEQTTIWSSARCCIPNCCMKSVGSPASAARVCAAAASNSA